MFAYLGRRNARFIRNTARIVPLTSFLCIYPKNDEHVEQIWKILNHPDTMTDLPKIGKTYGDGAIKVEPRLREKLPIADHVVEQFGFPIQMRLFEQGETYTVGRDKADEGGTPSVSPCRRACRTSQRR